MVDLFMTSPIFIFICNDGQRRGHLLWIDSLCIIQDTNPIDSNPDWTAEAGKMGDIYAGGIFNIAAVDAKHTDEGLFPTQRTALPVVSRQNDSIQIVCQSCGVSESHESFIISNLLSRGWVYQEVLLTPTNLLCTKEQMW